MAYQQKEGQGSLFKNEKQNDRQPDFKGSIMIKGVLYNVSAWNRTSQNGREYISLQAEERPVGGESQFGSRQSQGIFVRSQPSCGQDLQPGGVMSSDTAPQYAPSPRLARNFHQASGSQFASEDIPAPGLDDIPSEAFGADLPSSVDFPSGGSSGEDLPF